MAWTREVAALSQEVQTEGLGTSLQDRDLLASPTSQPGISPGGEKPLGEAAVLSQNLPAGGSRSAQMVAPHHRGSALHYPHLEKGLWRVSRASWMN